MRPLTFSLGKLLRSDARLGHRGFFLVVPWAVVVSPCPSVAQKAKGLVEMAQMGHFHRFEAVPHLAAFAQWPEEVSGGTYGLEHLKMSFTTSGLKISALNYDLLYLPVCKGKIKQKILVHEQCLEWLCMARASHPKLSLHKQQFWWKMRRIWGFFFTCFPSPVCRLCGLSHGQGEAVKGAFLGQDVAGLSQELPQVFPGADRSVSTV